MTSIYRDILPSILPTDDILVEDEAHRYVSQERPDGSVFTQQRYQLNKAPIDEIQKVEGEVNGRTYEFKSGQDYKLDEREFIDFSVGGQSPDTDTDFYVTYVSRSILDRYIEGHEEEIETVADKRQESIDSRFVDRATGTELEEIGSLFGSLGERRGRDDNEYRLYLKSLVQSFSGRGRKEDLKFAVASAFGSGAASFRIEENFEEVEYTIELDDWPPHKVGTLVELLELADPSGVELRKISYNVDEERMEVDDTINATVSTRIETDELGSDDNVLVDPRNFDIDEDTSILDEAFVEDGLQFTEEVDVSEIIDINEDNLVEPEEVSVQDTTERTPTKAARWDGERVGWNFFEWQTLLDLSVISSDGVEIQESTSIDGDLTVIEDESVFDDIVNSDKNLTEILEEPSVADSTSVTEDDVVVIEDISSEDIVFIDEDKKSVVSPSSFDDDVVETVRETERWSSERHDWDFFQWADKPENIPVVVFGGESGSTDSASTNTNKLTASDEGLSDDAVVIDANKAISPDESSSSDEVIIDGSIVEIGDTATSFEVVDIDNNKTTISPETASTDEVSTLIRERHRWGEEKHDWEFFDWDEPPEATTEVVFGGSAGSTDGTIIDGRKLSVGDVSSFNDSIARTVNTAVNNWNGDKENWDFFEWE